MDRLSYASRSDSPRRQRMGFLFSQNGTLRWDHELHERADAVPNNAYITGFKLYTYSDSGSGDLAEIAERHGRQFLGVDILRLRHCPR